MPVIRSHSKFKSWRQIAGTLTAYGRARRTAGSWIASPPGSCAIESLRLKPTYIRRVPWIGFTSALPEALITSIWSGATLVMMSTLPAISSAARVEASGMMRQMMF